MIITEFDIKINKDTVLGLVDLRKDDPLYADILEELEGLLSGTYEKIKPAVICETGSLKGISEEYDDDGHEALFVIVTAGGEISRWSSTLFSEGRYMSGLLADAVADDYLFQMEPAVAEIVKEFCISKNKGVCARLEAPRDIPMTAQKRALEATNADELLGIDLTENFMFDPVKTMCRIYILDDDKDRFDIYRSCKDCPDTKCNLRDTYE